jgi:hypothetical protein
MPAVQLAPHPRKQMIEIGPDAFPPCCTRLTYLRRSVDDALGDLGKRLTRPGRSDRQQITSDADDCFRILVCQARFDLCVQNCCRVSA